MTPDRVRQYRPLILDDRARDRYHEDGFLAVPGYVSVEWLRRLRAVVAAKIDESRALSASDDQFDLAPDHSAEKPNIRRLRKAVDQHPELWAYARDASVVDLVADLLGPDLRFHSSKLNFKWSAGGEVHGSAANYSDRMRPLLLNVYAAADALPITPAPAPTSHTGELVRGQEPCHVHMEPYPARLPPRRDRVCYRSIFAAQSSASRPVYAD